MVSTIKYLVALARPHKRLMLMSMDSLLALFASLLALGLLAIPLSLLTNHRVLAVVLTPGLATPILFSRLGLYQVVLRYITGQAMPQILTGIAATSAIMAGMNALLASGLPATLAIIHGMVSLILLTGFRFGMRRILRLPGNSQRTPVIIYGAGNAGQQLVAALHQGIEYKPAAFVDDDQTLQGSTVSGVRVHPTSDLRALIKKWAVREVLLAMPSISRARRRKIVSQLETLGVEVKTIVSMNDVVAGRAKFAELRTVTPEDLLGRDTVPPNPNLMRRTITGKVVLVTGAGGSIGSELCRQIVRLKPKALILLDNSEYALYAINTELRDTMSTSSPRIIPILGSVQNPGRMRAILRKFSVHTVFHAAAYKHVGLVEENIIEGIHNNVFGTKVIAEAAAEAKVETFILVSTDKTVRPSNIMGATKRIAELTCQALDQEHSTVFCMVRFGNVLGSSGSVIPRFREQIERGGPVTVTHRQVNRFFMTIPEAAQLVIQAGAMAKGGDVFVLDMGQPVRILDLAQSMIRLHGLTPYIVDEAGTSETESGDIAIRITGLGKGEKLFEELLIGNNPCGTEHPRIMTASETALSPAEMRVLLDHMMQACKDFDLGRIQQILNEAPLDYRPQDTTIHDLMWPPEEGHLKSLPALRVIDGASKT
ncbi:nucleoside-diphosphate sugar epimerase/dehydratase [Pararhodobacter sp. CCB-MM2]|uniref:polysaccharide biosynthesis protein n=1 Tax=Pararhodobacter sp. CCB-MM2 TaxID=1786003 RepID=UPI000A716CA5|nr:nucleoside-diphosphate sugar epimerase/dehydratase [Pararhodobacter sp. CCB-MM2]